MTKIELDRTAVILAEIAEAFPDLTVKEAEQVATTLQEFADYRREEEKHEPRKA